MSHVAVIGAGLMGQGWIAALLAHGFAVKVYDPSPEVEVQVRAFLPQAFATLEASGLRCAVAPPLAFAATAAEAAQGAVFVQENGPERLDLKQRLFAELDEASDPDVVIASSTSGIRMSLIQQDCSRPERMVIGHPMNPPHVMPLVEVCGGERTDRAYVDRAVAFYRGLGKTPIVLRKELPGHAVNRLQSAIAREAIHLVASGALSVADVDLAMRLGPGLRSAKVGPLLNMHLAGGPGGLRPFLAQFGPGLAASWKALGETELTSDVQEALAGGVDEMIAGRSHDQLVGERDAWVLDVLRALNPPQEKAEGEAR